MLEYFNNIFKKDKKQERIKELEINKMLLNNKTENLKNRVRFLEDEVRNLHNKLNKEIKLIHNYLGVKRVKERVIPPRLIKKEQ